MSPDTDDEPADVTPAAECGVDSPDEQLDEGDSTAKSGFDWKKSVVFGVVPLVAILLAAGAGFLKWQEGSVTSAGAAGVEATQAGKDATIALLSYDPATVDTKLVAAAHNLLTGEFQAAYTSLVTDVVIPGAKEKRISAVATVPAVSLMSASRDHAQLLAFVDQTVVIGAGAPTATASSVQVTMDRVNGRWLVSKFQPV
jgi:Mce-associated membrane protein